MPFCFGLSVSCILPPMDPLGLKPQSNRDDAIVVVRTLREAGHVAYFAGGCVRDQLLGIEPKDFDVATDAPPKRVRELFKKTQAVGQAFGVILVRLNQSVIEVATFRSDGVYDDGRRPTEVTFTTADEDAKRRDFTINGLFYDPLEDRVIDYVGGQQDLDARVLRAIGDASQRFAEDHLRMLRAVRFAARFGFAIETQTAEAIRRDRHLLPRISGERIGDELRRMLSARTRANALTLLWSLGLVEPVFSLTGAAGREFNNARSLLMALPADRELNIALPLLATLVDTRWQAGGAKHDLLGNFTPTEVAKVVQTARSRLKLSNDETDDMLQIARLVHTLINTREPPIALLKRSLATAQSPMAWELLHALARAGFAPERIHAVDTALLHAAQTDCAPIPLLNGDDLVSAGYRPGPGFKKTLDAVYDAQLESRITTRDAAMDLARTMLTQ